MAASSQAYWVDTCLMKEMVYACILRLSGWQVLMATFGFCKFLILGSASITLHFVGVRKIPHSTVRPLKART